MERKNGILKQRIKLRTSKTTLTGWTKVLFQVLTHSNDQPVGPVAPYARMGNHAGTLNPVKIAPAPTLTVGQCAKVHHNWERLYLLAFTIGPPTWIRELLHTLGEGELLSFPWDLTVLLQTGPIEMHYTWNGTYTIGRGGKCGGLGLAYSTPDHLLTPDSDAFPS